MTSKHSYKQDKKITHLYAYKNSHDRKIKCGALARYLSHCAQNIFSRSVVTLCHTTMDNLIYCAQNIIKNLKGNY